MLYRRGRERRHRAPEGTENKPRCAARKSARMDRQDRHKPLKLFTRLRALPAAARRCRRARFARRAGRDALHRAALSERLGTPFAQDLGPGLASPEAFANPPVSAGRGRWRAYDEGRRATSSII
jgi:hypothetical protein